MISFFKKRKTAAPEDEPSVRAADGESEDYTLQVCTRCGRGFRWGLANCPNCGAPARAYRDTPKNKSVPQRFTGVVDPREEILAYLRAIGKEEDAARLFSIRVELPESGQLVRLELAGSDNGDEALRLLREKGRLEPGCTYAFTNWPMGSTKAGMAFPYLYACVCELPDVVYRLRKLPPKEEELINYLPEPVPEEELLPPEPERPSDDDWRYVELYGCPSALGPAVKAPGKKAELIDY